jgi:hypothetical protein
MKKLFKSIKQLFKSIKQLFKSIKHLFKSINYLNRSNNYLNRSNNYLTIKQLFTGRRTADPDVIGPRRGRLVSGIRDGLPLQDAAGNGSGRGGSRSSGDGRLGLDPVLEDRDGLEIFGAFL